ncbi:MAG TPA: roadblock/LC7 domain-containing protein [Pseudonocardiaceae bacterium]|jgi:predicted regulator of Ras-like GTPase activity (Roadblock/LC7/MglB family)|nr:roadblock/LC7 domain-containing protein [Pseudonocardiaceae bacterium]
MRELTDDQRSPMNPASPSIDAGWLLRNLLEQVPHARSAVVLAADGIPRAWQGLSQDNAQYLAATAAALIGAAHGMGNIVEVEGRMRQIVLEHDRYLAIFMAAGQGSILAVHADRAVNASHLAAEMVQMINGLRAHLATPSRTPAVRGDAV